jgi:hypothetical protein
MPQAHSCTAAKNTLFDLVGERDQLRRNLEAKRLRSLRFIVSDLARPFKRKIAGPSVIENLVDE